MKGISPLIATVLLIVLVIAISTLVTNWTTNFTRNAQDDITNSTDIAVKCSGAQVDIKDVYLANGSLASGSVVIENIGLVDNLRIVSVNIYNKTGSNFSASGLPISGFNRGQIATVQFVNASIPNCLAFDKVIVATNCVGAVDTFKTNPVGC